MVIKRVGPLSCAKVVAALYMIVGVAIGALISLGSMVGGMAGGMASDAPWMTGIGAAIGIAAIIVLPIVYGSIGFVATLIGAWLYNVAAGIMGGIEVDVQ
jgi:hypothetical protein